MKHGNKHWEREKEYYSLLKCQRYLYYTDPRNRWKTTNKELDRVDRKLTYKYYDKYHGIYDTAPRWYRKMKNRIQRAKSKQILYKELKGYDVCYEDNYKDCAWYW
jgi:hypothetical protein